MTKLDPDMPLGAAARRIVGIPASTGAAGVPRIGAGRATPDPNRCTHCGDRLKDPSPWKLWDHRRGRAVTVPRYGYGAVLDAEGKAKIECGDCLIRRGVILE